MNTCIYTILIKNTNNYYSYMSNYVISILYLQADPIRS